VSQPKDGGAAFPCRTNTNGQSFAIEVIDPVSKQPFVIVEQPGMTMRDYFAGLAMQARIIALGDHKHEARNLADALKAVDECHASTAERAYRHADAMIAERERSGK
jgi:hypothetical protein